MTKNVRQEIASLSLTVQHSAFHMLSATAHNYVLYSLEFMIFYYNIHKVFSQTKGSDFLDSNYFKLGGENI